MYTFYRKIPPLGVKGGGGVEIYKFWSPSPTYAIFTKIDKDWPSSFWKENVTDNGRRRTPIQSNRSPEWLRWPNKSMQLFFWIFTHIRINQLSFSDIYFAHEYRRKNPSGFCRITCFLRYGGQVFLFAL